MKTAVFVDIDGVLNYFAYQKDAPVPNNPGDWQQWVLPAPNFVTGYSSPIVVQSLAELSARPNVDLIWATTWVEFPDALDWFREHVTGPHGVEFVGRIDRIDRSPDGFLRGCGKLSGVVDILSSGNYDAFVWIDDMLSDEEIRTAFESTMIEFGNGIVPEFFLSVADIEQIHELIDIWEAECG